MTHLGAAGALWAMSAMLLLCQCGCGGGSAAPGAHVDASVRDSGSGEADIDATEADARLDATFDAASDGEPEEAGFDGPPIYTGDACPPPLDAGIISDYPGFRRLTELDPCCASDVAIDPAQAEPPIAWVPCVNGAAGCTEMPGGDSVDLAQVSVAPDGTPGYLLLYRRLSANGLENEADIYAFSTLTPQAATWFSGGSTTSMLPCETLTAVGETSATVLGFDYIGAPVGSYLMNGPPSSFSAVPPFVQVASTDLTLDGLQGWGSSDTTIGFDLSFGGALGRVSMDGGGFASGAVPGGVGFTFASRADVFGVSSLGTAGWGQIYVLQPDGTLTLFRSNPNAHVTGIATDGPNLYWAETYGSTNNNALQTDSQIWTAPYTDDPTVLAATARQVADIPNTYVPYQAVAFGGLYATIAYAVRSSDGAFVPVPTAGNYQIRQVVYVTESDVWAIMYGAFARVQIGQWPDGG